MLLKKFLKNLTLQNSKKISRLLKPAFFLLLITVNSFSLFYKIVNTATNWKRTPNKTKKWNIEWNHFFLLPMPYKIAPIVNEKPPNNKNVYVDTKIPFANGLTNIIIQPMNTYAIIEITFITLFVNDIALRAPAKRASDQLTIKTI